MVIKMSDLERFILTMLVSLVVGALLMGTFMAEEVGIGNTVQEEVRKCEAVIPRNQICGYKIVTIPKGKPND